MKSAVAVLGLAAIANAFEFPKHAQYHNKRSNYTEPAGTTAAAGSGSDYTTVTVLTTQVRTVTSCAPTVTNCPAHQTAIDQLPANQKHVVYVTDTVVLTETVCPVSEAGKVSSSVIQQAQTGGITPQYTITATTPGQTTTPAAAAIPLSTGYSSPVTDSDSSGGENTSLTTLVKTTTVDKTLTLTISNQVTTTTVQSTIETTVTVPCSQVTDQAVQSGDNNSGVTPTKGSGSGNSYGQGSSATDDTTTTVTGTKTVTITLTVSGSEASGTGVSGGDNSGQNNGYATAQSTPSATGGNSSSENNNSGSNGSSSGNSGSEGSCECNGATATVTVTQPASTVYVTVGTQAPTTTAPYSSESTGSNNSGNNDSGDDEDDEDDDSCEDDITTTLQATVTVVPYPINGTTAAPTGYAKPSGFARLVR